MVRSYKNSYLGPIDAALAAARRRKKPRGVGTKTGRPRRTRKQELERIEALKRGRQQAWNAVKARAEQQSMLWRQMFSPLSSDTSSRDPNVVFPKIGNQIRGIYDMFKGFVPSSTVVPPSGGGFPEPPSEIPPFTTGSSAPLKYHPANRYFVQNYVFEGKSDKSRGGRSR